MKELFKIGFQIIILIMVICILAFINSIKIPKENYSEVQYVTIIFGKLFLAFLVIEQGFIKIKNA